MAKLPKSVQIQADAADKLIEDLNNPKTPEEGETLDIPSSEGKESDFKAQYNTLQGKYNAEVPLLHEKLRDVEDLVGKLTAQIASQSATLTKVTQGEEKEPAGVSFIKEEMPEIDEAIRYYLNKTVPEMITKEIGKVEGRFNTLENTTTNQAHTHYEDTLNSVVPDWRVLNTNPEFLKWLEGTDRYSNRPRFDLLRNAHDKFDAKTVSNFFNDFKTVKGIKTTNKGKVQAFPPKGAQPEQIVEDEDDTSGYMSKESIQQFSDEFSQGRYRNRMEEAKKILAQIDKAQREGKIK